MKYLIFCLILLFTNVCFAQEKTYSVLDKFSFKETATTTTQNTTEETYTLTNLLEQKVNVETEILRQQTEFQEVIASSQKRLTEIEALIVKARELGIKEEVIVEPIE